MSRKTLRVLSSSFLSSFFSLSPTFYFLLSFSCCIFIFSLLGKNAAGFSPKKGVLRGRRGLRGRGNPCMAPLLTSALPPCPEVSSLPL